MKNSWGADIPVYVTREDGHGRVGKISFAAWAVVLLQILFLFNAIGWGVFGAVELILKVV